MYKKIFYILLASLFLIIPLNAQEVQEEIIEDAYTIPDYTQEELEDETDAIPYYTQEEPEDDIDSLPNYTMEEITGMKSPYIESFRNKFSLRFSLYQSNLNFDQLYRFKNIHNEEHESKELYKSNRPLVIGLGFLYGSLGLEFQKQTNLLYDTNYAKTESQELKLNYYSKSAVLEFHMKDYKGFHTDSNEDTDLEMRFIGISGQYICNSDEYSWPAAFGLYERQLRSASSWLLGGDVLYFTSERQQPLPYKRKYSVAIPKIGYGLTSTLTENLFLSLSLSLGAGIAREFNEAENYASFSGSYHVAVGYHWKDVSFIISHQDFLMMIVLDKIHQEYYLTRLTQCSVTKRF